MVRAERQEERIAALERQVASLTEQLERLTEGPNGVVPLRPLSRQEARAEIIGLFETGETLYYSDIVGRLGIDIDDVIEICNELEREGRIETLGDAAKSR